MKKYKLIAFFGVLLLLSLSTVIILNSSRAENIKVTGSEHYTDEELVEMFFDKSTDAYAPLAYLRYKLFEQKSIPFIEYVDVELEDKNTLSLYVYEKSISACIEAMGGYLYFDKDGIVVESTKERFEGIVLIKGLKFDRLVLNEPFEVQNPSLFKTVNDLCLLIKKNELAVDTVEFSDSYEVTLYVGETVVRLGKKTNYDSELNELGNILSALNDKKLILDMEDFGNNNGKVTAKPIE